MNQFVDFMPDVYGRLYDSEEIAQHAAIAARRGSRLVHAEPWQSPTGPLLCVVADDRPGLLALMTDALLTQGMTIQSARVFCRDVGHGRVEAVDFLELAALRDTSSGPAALDGDSLSAFTEFLSELVANDSSKRPSRPSTLPGGEPTRRVYFERQQPAEGCYLLVVDAPDSHGLLHAVSAALHEKEMRIMACEIRTVDGWARDRFEVEPISARGLSDSELCDVQLAVLEALRPRR